PAPWPVREDRRQPAARSRLLLVWPGAVPCPLSIAGSAPAITERGRPTRRSGTTTPIFVQASSAPVVCPAESTPPIFPRRTSAGSRPRCHSNRDASSEAFSVRPPPQVILPWLVLSV